MSRKRIIVVVVLILVLLVGVVVSFFLFFPVERETFLNEDEVKIEDKITVASQVGSFQPNLSKENSKFLEEYLRTIKFWDKGVVYGETVIEGEKKVSRLRIVFTSEWQDHSRVTRRDGGKVLSSLFKVEDDTGILLVFVDPVLTKQEGVERYILGELFRVASWPREQWQFYSEEYLKKKSAFAEGYYGLRGQFLEL